MKTDSPQMIFLKDYKAPDYWIDQVELVIRLDATATRVKSKLFVRPNLDNFNRAELTLNGEEIALISVAMNGESLGEDQYNIVNEEFILLSPPQEAFSLEFEVEINPQTNTQLMGLYLSEGIFCTQCEAEGFRRITYFLDRPDVMSVYTVRLEAEKNSVPILLANGNPIESGALEEGWHYSTWHDPHPKPSYLFAVVGGSLDVITDQFVTQSKRSVDLAIYVEPGKADQAHYAMDALKRSMKWDEEVFGCEYDLDIFNIVAVSNFNMGAMENKGLNVFNDKYVLARPDTATDADYEGIESVIAHEYFHNWTGNRITCRDWFQLCLKEGLTVFRDQEFSADMRSRTVQRIKDVKRLRAAQFPEDAGPLSHPVRPQSYSEINNFYTATIYEKGAELIRMLKTILGETGFKSGMDLYFDRHDGEATTIEAFLDCFSDATGFDLHPFLNWYNQAGTPHVRIEQSYDREERSLTLDISQITKQNNSETKKTAQIIPIKIALIMPNDKELSPATHLSEHSEIQSLGDCLILDQDEATAVFENIPQDTIISAFREFSAPVTYEINQSQNDFMHIALRDSDGFNRWSALQSLSENIILNIGSGQKPDELLIGKIASALSNILNDPDLDDDYKALCLSPPTLGDLMRQQGKNVIPEALATAREGYLKLLAKEISSELLLKYQSIITVPSQMSAKAAGRRSLRHACLGLLKYGLSTQAFIEQLEIHYKKAGNMTEKSVALDLACQIEDEKTRAILKDFEFQYSHEGLIMDKWLSSQSGNVKSNPIEKVSELLEHPHFSRKTPNRVYALLGGFCFRNLRAFHAANGSGYAFMAQQILLQDSINPQIAARLLTCFRSWRSLHPELQTKAEIALRQLNKAENLSKDVRDILTRTLNG